MTCIHTFSDGNRLLLLSNGMIMVEDKIRTYFKNNTIKLHNSRNGDTIAVKLVGFNIDTDAIKNDGLTEPIIEQLNIIYEASKGFHGELLNLYKTCKYVIKCKPFSNVSFGIDIYDSVTIIFVGGLYVISAEVFGDRMNFTQQECETAIMELLDKLVIYNTTMRKPAK